MRFAIHHAETPADFDALRSLLREYAEHLKGTVGSDHICFTAYEHEVEALPGPYRILLLASVPQAASEQPEQAGCVLLKSVQPSGSTNAEEVACEMKRFWVRPRFRGHGLGRELVERALSAARHAGFTAMYLDTVPQAMAAANHIYSGLGFEAVARYNDNSVTDVAFFRLAL